MTITIGQGIHCRTACTPIIGQLSNQEMPRNTGCTKSATELLQVSIHAASGTTQLAGYAVSQGKASRMARHSTVKTNTGNQTERPGSQ